MKFISVLIITYLKLQLLRSSECGWIHWSDLGETNEDCDGEDGWRILVGFPSSSIEGGCNILFGGWKGCTMVIAIEDCIGCCSRGGSHAQSFSSNHPS